MATLCLVMSPSAVGIFAALAAGPLVLVIARRRLAAVKRPLPPAEVSRAPIVIELAAVLLDAGLPVAAAVEGAAACAGPELGGRLRRVSGLLRLGAPAGEAWGPLSDEPSVRPLALVAVRSADSGVALAAAFRRVAAEIRADDRLSRQRRAQRVGVWAVAPLGLCFLPAFVCLGVVPVVIGVARPLLGDLGP